MNPIVVAVKCPTLLRWNSGSVVLIDLPVTSQLLDERASRRYGQTAIVKQPLVKKKT